jgi:hypothetical protein
VRPLLFVLPLLTLSGCYDAPNAPPAPPARGVESLSDDASCEDIQRRLDEWLRRTASCAEDDDCVVMPIPGAFCRNWCERAAGLCAAGATLDALGAALEAHGCQTAGCACVRPPDGAVCREGRCQPMP